MWKRSALAIVLCSGVWAVVLFGPMPSELLPTASGQAPQRGLPPGPMQEKARTACLACHTASIIVQQQLDRRVWTKEIDKMIRWGAPVAAEDREALIDYLVQHFGPREAESSKAALAPGLGADKVRTACLSCHDEDVIAQQRLERRAWTGEIDKMIRWGAVVRAEDREVILNYLATNYPAPAHAAKQRKPQ